MLSKIGNCQAESLVEGINTPFLVTIIMNHKALSMLAPAGMALDKDIGPQRKLLWKEQVLFIDGD